MQPKSYQLGCIAVLFAAACGPRPQAVVDDGLEREIAQIRAIDNHAHPVRVTAAGEQPDRDFDALPVDNMEPQSDPLAFRPGSPLVAQAARTLYTGQPKARTIEQRGTQYPSWVL